MKYFRNGIFGAPIAIILIGLAIPPSPVLANEPPKISAGFEVGYDLTTLSTSNSAGTSFGGRGSYFWGPNLSAGLGVTFTGTTPSGAPAGTNSSLTLIMGDATFHFTNHLKGLFLGVRMGLSMHFSSLPQVVSTNNNLAMGILGGYDFHLSRSLSVGPQISYSMILTPLLSSIIQLHGVLKYWY